MVLCSNSDLCADSAGTEPSELAAAKRRKSADAARRLYPAGFGKEVPDAILIATGSEVQLAVAAKAALAEEGIDVRVVSMPSMDVFDRQVKEYQEKVLPNAVRKRVAIEALSGFGWGKYVGLDGKVVAMPGFGASAPANLLFEKFGFTVDNVVATVKSIL